MVSLSGLRAQNQRAPTYRETVEEFRADADRGVEHVLALPEDVIARGIEEAVRPESIWPRQACPPPDGIPSTSA